jgi:tight adherence protein C
LAVDEEAHRSSVIIPLCSALVVGIVCWGVRPRIAVRAAAPHLHTRRAVRIVCMGVVAATVALVAPIVGLAMLVGGVIARRAFAVRRTSRATRQITADYPDALDLLVLSIRAGYLPAQAIGEIARFLPESLCRSFAAVDEAMRRGMRFADALNQLPAQLGAIAQPLVDSLSSSERYGLPLAPVLERLALESRQQRRRQSDAAARELPVRLAMPLVLCTLPSFVLLAIVPLLLGALSSLHT